MSLFRKMGLPLTLLGAAAALGGCVGDASLEGDDEQETQIETAEAAGPESADSVDPDAAEAVGSAQQAVCPGITHSSWICKKGHTYVSEIVIWWGHHDWDATWACNSWVYECGGGCQAQLAIPLPVCR